MESCGRNNQIIRFRLEGQLFKLSGRHGKSGKTCEFFPAKPDKILSEFDGCKSAPDFQKRERGLSGADADFHHLRGGSDRLVPEDGFVQLLRISGTEFFVCGYGSVKDPFIAFCR